MAKKFWIAFPVTFVLIWVLQFILHVWILGGFYATRNDGFLTETLMAARYVWLIIGFIILAFIWTYFYGRFAPEKGPGSGIWHGVAYMIFLYLPWGFINYSTLAISGYCYLWWTIGAIIQGIIVGAVMGAIMREGPERVAEPAMPPPRPTPAPAAKPAPEVEKSEG